MKKQRCYQRPRLRAALLRRGKRAVGIFPGAQRVVIGATYKDSFGAAPARAEDSATMFWASREGLQVSILCAASASNTSAIKNLTRERERERERGGEGERERERGREREEREKREREALPSNV